MPDFSLPRTRWSLVKRAAVSGGDGHAALNEWLTLYWYPLYAWARRRGASEEDAADGVQGFLEILCAKASLAGVDADRGTLRAWLLTAFSRHLASEHRHRPTQRRGGAAIHVSIDHAAAETAYQSEPADHDTPDQLYVRAWAVAVMDEAIGRVAAHYEKTGREMLFHALLPALESPLPETTYAEVADGLGLNPATIRVNAMRLRQRYRQALLEVAALRLGINCQAALEAELRVMLA